MNRETRDRVKAKFGGRCAYCAVPLASKFHVDHVFPKFRGGEDCEDNYYPACSRCNLWKKTFTIEQFRGEIGKQAERVRQKSAGFRLAEDFGLVQERIIEPTFWFEQYDPRPTRCPHNDCGYCYAPPDRKTNAQQGGCYRPGECPEKIRVELEGEGRS